MTVSKSFLCALLALVSILSAKPTLKLTLDRADHLYKCGEKATFTITFTDDSKEPLKDKATYIFSNDNGRQVKKGTIDLKSTKTLTLSETMDTPSFLRLVVSCKYTDKNGKEQSIKNNVCAAGFEPEKIQPSTANPADFMEYWKGEIKKADKECPLDVQMTKLDKYSNKKHTGYKISFAAPGGRVYGFLNIPAKPGKRPATVTVPGAGPGIASPRVNDDMVTLAINVHPYDPCTEGKTLKELYTELNRSGTYMYQGGKCRETTFFHRPIVGIARAIEWLAGRPEVDASRMGYFGSSQGGAFGFIMAGLTGRFAAIVCNVPAICDHFGAEMGRSAGWPQFRKKFRTKGPNGEHIYDKEIDQWLPYYDAINFARHIKCPVRVIVGFIDGTCSPSSVYAAFNSIPSKDKVIINETDMAHSTRESYYKSNAWMNELISK